MAIFVNDIQGKLNEIVHTLERASVDYGIAYAIFSDELEKRISSSESVRQIDGLLAPMLGWPSVRLVAVHKQVLDDSLDVVRQVEEHIKKKQSELFATRGAEINHWYDTMNPGAKVRYRRMEPGTDSLTMWADSFGVEMNAVSTLSQSQLNGLGLSIHFMRVLTPGSPFAFIVLDDPVQSMDEDHTQALISEVIEDLLEQRKLQVIICSHEQGLVDDIWETYYHTKPRRLRISEYGRTGPVIEDAETLQQCIERAKTLANGNEDNRRLALDVTRRSAELLVRSVCRLTKSPAPPHDATAGQMLPYLRSCPGVTPKQCQQLTRTVNFTNPAPHTQIGWAVPTIQLIEPHIQRVYELARTLGVLEPY
jgi:hypothetical protein